MAKKKSVLGCLLSFIITIIIILAILFGIGYYYVKNTFGVDIIQAVKYIKVLEEKPDTSKIIDNACTDDDYTSLQTKVNGTLNAQIINGNKTDGYTIDYPTLALMTENLILTDKECMAFIDIGLSSITNSDTDDENGGFDIGGMNLDIELEQIKFSNITAEGDVDMNIVIKADLSELSEQLTEFPLSLLKKYIPNEIYISATVTIDKDTNNYFAYTVTHKSLAINNLSTQDTQNILDIVNKFASFDASTITEKVGGLVANSLIGNADNNKGLGYRLYTTTVPLASDYTFTSNGYVIQKATIL